ncbi:MAG: hypothetical protein QGG40_08300, partial [Myxococcota bacterium]|nr:hypothetical protein [Myxococcota bacterium]
MSETVEVTTGSRQRTIHGRVGALFFMSLVMGFDLLFELLCVRLALLFYLLAAALGWLVGRKLSGWLSGAGGLRKALRGLVFTGCVLGLMGAVLLTFVPPLWTSHCGFRYCGRALGVGLTRSPFPVGTPSCRDLH